VRLEAAAQKEEQKDSPKGRTVPFNQRTAPINDGFVGVMREIWREGEMMGKGNNGHFWR
jgi:hypothetical protein